jgi:hypothetical protein
MKLPLSTSQSQNLGQNTKNKFFYLKTNNMLIPLNFFASYENLINNVVYEKEKNTLLLILNPINSNNNINGSITIQLPRSVIDSKTQDNKDNNFTVLLDNKPSKYLELDDKKFLGKVSDIENTVDNIVNNTNDRVLLIKFDKDTKVIKISGTDTSKNQNQIQIKNHPAVDETHFIIIIFFLIATPLIIYLFYRKKKIGLNFFKFKINKNKGEK